MSIVQDSNNAAGYLEMLQSNLWEQGDHSQDDNLASMICMLESPLFHQLLTLQESLQELNHVSTNQQLSEESFAFAPTGELILDEGVIESNEQAFESPTSPSFADSSFSSPGGAISTHSYNIEFQRTMEKAAMGREIETIKLFKPENSSLGFSVVGFKKESVGELGIFVQDVQPGGIAARDGRLREGVQILAIDGQPLDISQKEAIHILQSARGLVELVVARGPLPQPDPNSEEEDGEETKEESPPPRTEQQSSDMVLNTEWTQIEVIDLINDGTGLGFGIIGGRSTGVVVKTILPGGIADLDGRLHSGDHILQIGDVNVRGMSSEQVANVLRQSGSHVRLIVARAIIEPPPVHIPQAPVIRTQQLDEHLHHLNNILANESSGMPLDIRTSEGEENFGPIPHEYDGILEHAQVHAPKYEEITDPPEVEYFELELSKDSQGLGITIAGYVGSDNSPDDLSGIFVKSIAEKSAAAADGRVQVNDQIIQVDGKSLHGFSNHQAVELLRNTDSVVHLKIARYTHGPKYEKLQQYVEQTNQMVIAPPPPPLPHENNVIHTDLPLTNNIEITENPDQTSLVDLDDVNFYTDDDYKIKDGLLMESKKLDELLKDASLSQDAILQQMGVKSDEKQQTKAKEKIKPITGKSKNELKDSKKKQREASIEASKKMTENMLSNIAFDDFGEGNVEPVASTASVALPVSLQNSDACYEQFPYWNQRFSGASTSFSDTIQCITEANSALTQEQQYVPIDISQSNINNNYDVHEECRIKIRKLEERNKFLESSLLKEFMDKITAQTLLQLNQNENQNPIQNQNASDERDNVESNNVPLIEGRPLKIGRHQLGAARRKSPTATSLVRNLLLIYFDNEHLAARCARGCKGRQALDKDKLDTIIRGDLLPDVEVAIKKCWEPIIGNDFEVVVAQLSKFHESGGLGISLEGTVDVENGVEVHPHHFIRSILPDGPVGVNGRLQSSDELLEVNGKRLLGLNHKDVVGILKELPQHVRLVCARKKSTNIYAQQDSQFSSSTFNSGVSNNLPITDRLVKSKSEMALSSAEAVSPDSTLNKIKSRSLEPLTGLAVWSSEPVVIELEKGDKGLGFSILDYEDPISPNETVIVIRSLVPGGVAQMDGRLVPGDRLIFVNDINLDHASLDEAVQVLKGAPRGVVRIGVAKPLPFSETFHDDAEIPGLLDPPLPDTQPDQNPSAINPEIIQSQYTELSLNPVIANAANINLQHNDSFTSSSSASPLPKKSLMRNDSFYESDDELKTLYASPRRRSPKQKSPNQTANTYINTTAADSDASGKFMEPETPPPPYDYENLREINRLSVSPASDKSDKFTDRSHSEKDYVNASMALPSYEEAVSGMMERLTPVTVVAEEPPPPVPPRSESQEIMARYTTETGLRISPGAGDSSPERIRKTNLAESDESSDADLDTVTLLEYLYEISAFAPVRRKSSSSSSDSSSPVKEVTPPTTTKKIPPRIPPKPKWSQGQKSPHSKDENAPPLPPTSPPDATHFNDSSFRSFTDEEITISPQTTPFHQKSTSIDSSVSSSSDHLPSSDLKNMSSPSSTPKTMSPGMSPFSSPSIMRAWTGNTAALPPSLEKVIRLHKDSGEQLGITVESADKGLNGCIVKTNSKNGAIYKDGRIQIGDYIMSVNNESMRKITNAQARAIMRRASLLGIDISISYIPASEATAYKEAAATRSQEQSPVHYSSMPSPNSTLSPVPGQNNSETEGPSSPGPDQSKSSPSAVEFTKPRQKSLTTDGSPASGDQTWGIPRTVKLSREPGRSLGISIVGGRVDLFHVAQENIISGIFIKHVLEESPAGRNGTLKTGDRILEVDGNDLRNATHDQAVEVIRKSGTTVTFVVQSLSDPECPMDLEADTKSVKSYDEAITLPAEEAAITPVVQDTVAANPQPDQEPVKEIVVEKEEEVQEDEESEEEDEYGYSQEKLQRKYGDLNGELVILELDKGNSNLGLSLAGNLDRSIMSVFVAGIQPESLCAKDGRILVGDEILEINGLVLYGRSHLNASAMIKGIQTNMLKFIILRNPENINRMAIGPLKLHPPTPTFEERSPSHHNSSSPSSPLKEDLQTITLMKGNAGLGFAIIEETKDGVDGIFVKSITPGGVAAKEGSLKLGDQIMAVGDKLLNHVHYDAALDILRNSNGAVKIKIKPGSTQEPGAKNSVVPEEPKPEEKVEVEPVDKVEPREPEKEEDAEPADPKTCPVVPGMETEIEIEKGRTGLGLSIVGGADTLLGAIIIHEVYEDGAAARDGRLLAGDQILQVNGENLREATHDYAIQVLRQTPPVVRVTVYRDDNQQVREEDIYDVFNVDLMKKPGKGLGLSIVGKRNDVGVFISDIVKGGVAEADGRLMQGDQILVVNNEDLRGSTQEHAAAVLKTLMGKVSLTIGRLKAGSRSSSRFNAGGIKKSESNVSTGNKPKGKHNKGKSDDLTHIRTVVLQHDKLTGSLGLSIAGGKGSSIGDAPLIIANLTPGAPAALSGKLKIGDKIVSINNQETDEMSHDDAVLLLKSGGSVTLQVTQGEEMQVSVNGQLSRQISSEHTQADQSHEIADEFEEDDGPPPQIKNVTLQRGQEGLGFSIVGGFGSPHGDLPIYIKNVFSKGAAAEDGGLKRGDQILAVNNQSFEGVTHEEALSVLKNVRGTVALTVLS